LCPLSPLFFSLYNPCPQPAYSVVSGRDKAAAKFSLGISFYIAELICTSPRNLETETGGGGEMQRQRDSVVRRDRTYRDILVCILERPLYLPDMCNSLFCSSFFYIYLFGLYVQKHPLYDSAVNEPSYKLLVLGIEVNSVTAHLFRILLSLFMLT
jgi:hypothetical protein